MRLATGVAGGLDLVSLILARLGFGGSGFHGRWPLAILIGRRYSLGCALRSRLPSS